MKIETRFINGLRLLFALWVAIGHFYMMLGSYNFYYIPLISDLIEQPASAVDGFIVITGFLMAYNYYLRESSEPSNSLSTAVKFWTRRFFRLYPVYVVCLLLTFSFGFRLPLYINQGASSLSRYASLRTVTSPTYTNLIMHLTFLHGFDAKYVSSLLNPAWSLSLEIQFYILFPLIFFLIFQSENIAKTRLVPTLFITGLVAGVVMPHLFGIYGQGGLHFPQPSILFYKLPLFLQGMVMAGVILKKLNRSYLFTSLILLMPFQSFLTNIVLIFITSLLYLDLLSNTLNPHVYKILGAIKRFLSSNLFHKGSEISYSMYLIHWVFLAISFKLTERITNSFPIGSHKAAFLGLVLFLGMTILASRALYILIEKPFIQLGKRILSKNKETLIPHSSSISK